MCFLALTLVHKEALWSWAWAAGIIRLPGGRNEQRSTDTKCQKCQHLLLKKKATRISLQTHSIWSVKGGLFIAVIGNESSFCSKLNSFFKSFSSCVSLTRFVFVFWPVLCSRTGCRPQTAWRSKLRMPFKGKSTRLVLLGWPDLARRFHPRLVWLHNAGLRLPNQITTPITTGQIKRVLAG